MEGDSAGESEPVGKDVRCVLAGVDIWWAAGTAGLSPCPRQRKFFFFFFYLFLYLKKRSQDCGRQEQKVKD